MAGGPRAWPPGCLGPHEWREEARGRSRDTTAQLALGLGFYGLLSLLAVGSWSYISCTDPAKPGGIPCWRMAKTQGTVAYCSICRKEVKGLDHHCLFLNTCIGKRNYFFFFLLATSATLQMALQVVLCVLGMSALRQPKHDNPAFYALTSLSALTAVAAGGG